MKFEEWRRIVLNVFVVLSALTIAFLAYRRFDPFVFPGLEQRLSVFSALFGFITLALYSQEILTCIGNVLKKRLKVSVPSLKALPRREKKERVKRFRIVLEKIGSALANSLGHLRGGYLRECWLKLAAVALRNKKKLAAYTGCALPYLLFLWWLYPRVTFNEFVFFVLLAYIPVSVKARLDPRYPVAAAIFLLILCAVTLAQGFEEHANTLAIYAYYFLVIGVTLLFIDYFRR